MLLLSGNKLGFDSDSDMNRLSWQEFEDFSKVIAQDILKMKVNRDKVCLLGTARGALPLLTYISHKTGIRNISIVQLQMTNSDNPFDYGEVKVLLEAIREEFEEFIILEDIVYKGNTVKEIVKILSNKNKNIRRIYSLILDEGYISIGSNKIHSVSLLKAEKWIRFPWEE